MPAYAYASQIAPDATGSYFLWNSELPEMFVVVNIHLEYLPAGGAQGGEKRFRFDFPCGSKSHLKDCSADIPVQQGCT